MNIPIRLWAFVLIVFMSMLPGRADANNVAGGELIYEWITDSTYRFYFKIYNDCAGNPEPSAVTLCVRNTCNSTFFTRTLAKYTTPPPSPLPPDPYTCPQYKNQCDSPASTIPGAKVWWYTDTCTLPSRCFNWVFSVSTGNRVAGNTIANATSTEMYVEATLNNTGNYQGNSSPYFSIKPLSLACLNEPHSYNDGATDPNNDSLVVEVINPRTGGGTCPAAPANAAFASATPSLAIPANPFPSNNTFSMNWYTGAYAFTPVASGANTLVTRISEYRNGVKIGSVMRERSFYAMTCPPQASTGGSISCLNGAVGLTGSPAPFVTVEACAEQFSFCYSVTSANPAAKLVINDNHVSIAPGATVTYTNVYTDSVTGTFSWAPTATDTGLRILTVSLIDTVCNFPGVFTHQTFTIPIFIWSPTRALADTIDICLGDTARLSVIGGGNFQWTILSGTSGSLGCTNCNAPYATPAVTSQYIVTSTINPFCAAVTDTVTVNVLPHTYPAVNINVSPDTNVWPGLNVTFTATATNCTNGTYQWQKNGIDIPGANGTVWSSTTLADMDAITCRLLCSDACALPADTMSNAITMHVAVGIKEAKGTQAIHVYPNPNTGQFTIAGTAFIDETNIDLEVVNSIGQLVYRQKINKLLPASEVAIQLPGIAPGIYHLKIRAGGKVYNTQFAVSK